MLWNFRGLPYTFFFKVKQKVTPFPGLLFAAICPLWKLTPFLTIDNPNPVPPILRLRPLSDSPKPDFHTPRCFVAVQF